LDLEPAEVAHAIERLTVEIRFLDRIVIDDRQPSYPPRRQVLEHRAAAPAGADDGDRGGREARLAAHAYLGQHDLARVAIAHRRSSAILKPPWPPPATRACALPDRGHE